MTRLSVFVMLVMLAACESAPLQFTSPVQPPSTAAMVTVSVGGLVIDGDREVPLPGAVVKIPWFTAGGEAYPESPVSATTDANGAFRITVSLPQTWTGLGLGISRDGYEELKRGYGVIPQTVNRTFPLMVYPSIRIRPGESLATRVYLGAYGCSDGICRRVIVDAPPGEAIDVELTPTDGNEKVGLVVGEPPYPLQAPYRRQLTVTGGEVWIVAETAAHVTLKATRR